MTLKELAFELLERYRTEKRCQLDARCTSDYLKIKALNKEWEDYRKKIEEATAEDWKPFKLRALAEEEREEYPPEITGIWREPLPDNGQDILVSDEKYVWEDVFCDDGEFCYLENHDYLTEGMAWMPKPKPYKPKEANT